MMKSKLLLVLLIAGCGQVEKTQTPPSADNKGQFQALSLKGDSLMGMPSPTALAKYDSVRSIYLNDTLDVDNIIWFGRFTAYKKSYQEAISIYTRALAEYPDDPRLYRHRGHRNISVREFDDAIRDLSFAASLIEDQENEVEPDGAPNAMNIPVSTLHGNIWYHLGLAYYLKHDWENALDAYKNCLQSSGNHDNVVSATHWLYMIARRMGDEETATRFLEAIYPEMEIIENFSYYRLCLFYKGLMTEEELLGGTLSQSQSAAIQYGLANWYFYNGDKQRAKEIIDQILAGSNWDSFGYIAAEADYVIDFPE